tara:strand:- start:8942 stop:9619 length:678 start_codon:yes stop_codon:yes gene_type:complete
MSETLFDSLRDYKLCLNTLLSEKGLISKRKFTIHPDFKNIDLEETNIYSNNIIVANKPGTKLFLYIYLVNNTNFLSKTHKTKFKNNIFDMNKYIKELYNLEEDINISVDLVVILTKKFKINNQILEKKITDKILLNNIQIFSYEYLLFNICNHNYQPNSIRVITLKDEIKQICELKNISNKSLLAKISINDPLSKFYGLKKGELFEFIRISQNSGFYITYRLGIM